MTPSVQPIVTSDADDHGPPFLRAWQWWLGPALVTLVLVWTFRDPFIGDWDALEYTTMAVRGRPSSMALGRSLFIFFNHWLYRFAQATSGLGQENAYQLFKGTVIAASALATIACWQLARELTKSVEAATIAALLVAVSPIFVMYGGQVMTDVPSLLFVTLALIVSLRGFRSKRIWLVLAGAAILGASMNLRETAAIYATWLLLGGIVYGWRLKSRDTIWLLVAGAVFAVIAIGPWAYFYLGDIGNYRHEWSVWRESMIAEAARHPIAFRNLKAFVVYFFLLSPITFLVLPLATIREWLKRGLTPLFAITAMGTVATLLQFFNYAATINWRYFLTGLPALVPIVSAHFVRTHANLLGTTRRGFFASLLWVFLTAGVFGALLTPIFIENLKRRVLTKEYVSRLSVVPRDGVVMAGTQTIAVNYARGIGLGDWETIGTGAGWPGEYLIPTVERYHREGRRVFVDTDPRWWSPCGWQKAEIPGLVALESKFGFRRFADAIFEIRPLTDRSAGDRPNLQQLLPENRPIDVQRCGGIEKIRN